MKNIIMNNKNEKTVLIISVIIAVLSAYSAIRGFLDERLYGGILSTGVFKPAYMAGTISQDIITIASSVVMVVLAAIYVKWKNAKVLIAILGLMSYYFYAYGTYVISVLYTPIYFVYMIIFALSMFGMILGVSGFSMEDIKGLHLPKWIRISSAAFLAFIAGIFVPMWVSMMIPYIKNHTVPDFFAIYILDLCFVIPFFIAVIYMLIRKYKSAYTLLGIALMKTITLILAVTIGEITVPAHGMDADIAMIVLYSMVVVIGSLLYGFYCLKLKSCRRQQE